MVWRDLFEHNPPLHRRWRGALLLLLACFLLCGWDGTPTKSAEKSTSSRFGWLWPFGSRRGVLAHVAVRDCQLHKEDFQERGNNRVARVRDDRGEERCGFAIGAGPLQGGKLIPPAFPAANDVWIKGRVFFPEDFRLPQTPLGPQGKPCNMGVHLWRLYSNLDDPLVTVDFNVPSGSDRLQLYIYFTHEANGTGKPIRGVARTLEYQPAADGRRGRWQLWELHLHLGKPGKADGFLRFYADGNLAGSLEQQSFLPRGAGRDWWIRYMDVQSNISEGACHGTLWPLSNQWVTDDITVCRGERCR